MLGAVRNAREGSSGMGNWNPQPRHVPEAPLAGHTSVPERPAFAVRHLRPFLD